MLFHLRYAIIYDYIPDFKAIEPILARRIAGMTYITPQQAWIRSLKKEVTVLTLVFMGLQVLTNLFSVAGLAVFSGSLSAPAAAAAAAARTPRRW